MPSERNETWASLVVDGRAARLTLGRLQWVLGDLALEACPLDDPERYGEQALERYAEEIGIAFDSLSTYRRVANAFEKRTRVRDLTFRHHQVVAGSDDRIELLREAKKENWSARRLDAVVVERGEEKIAAHFRAVWAADPTAGITAATVEEMEEAFGDYLPADFFEVVRASPPLSRSARSIRDIAEIEDSTDRLSAAMAWVRHADETGYAVAPDVAARWHEREKERR